MAKWRPPPYDVEHTVADVRVAVHMAGMAAAHPHERAAVHGVLTNASGRRYVVSRRLG